MTFCPTRLSKFLKKIERFSFYMVCIKITERNYAANVVLIHVSIKQESDTFSVTNECISIGQNTCFFFFKLTA